MKEGTITKVSGPLVEATGMEDANINDVVEISENRLIGEIIEMRGDKASIQVYEDTSWIGPGEPVYKSGHPFSAELAPGLLGQFFDGIQRPLDKLSEISGAFLVRGVSAPPLNREKNGTSHLWHALGTWYRKEISWGQLLKRHQCFTE